jgi:hypothetical protein
MEGCPLRRVPGGEKVLAALTGLAAAGPPACPAPVVALRAALARSPPARALRPKPAAVRVAAAMAAAAVVSAPAGRARRRHRRFSAPWVVYTHLPVPIVAMLRKVLFLPRVAALATIAASLAGSFIGARA